MTSHRHSRRRGVQSTAPEPLPGAEFARPSDGNWSGLAAEVSIQADGAERADEDGDAVNVGQASLGIDERDDQERREAARESG